jgi:hypothetical protein
MLMTSNISISISADSAPLRADFRMFGHPAPQGALTNPETRADMRSCCLVVCKVSFADGSFGVM